MQTELLVCNPKGKKPLRRPGRIILNYIIHRNQVCGIQWILLV